MNRHMLGVIAIGLLAALSACQPAAPSPTPTPAATLTPSATPTATHTPIPTLDRTATAEAEVAAETAAVADFVSPDLEVAGYTADQGELMWRQSGELSLFNGASSNFLYRLLEPGFKAANFFFSTDIEWNFKGVISTYGYTTCGVIFRAADVDSGEQAQFNVIFINPLAYPAWDIELWDHGQYQSTFGESLRVGFDIQQKPPYQGAYGDPENPFLATNSNHFLLVADGSTVTVYANGALLGSAEVDANLTEGEFGILAGALHGQKWYEADPSVSCTFTNTWIWALP